MTEFAATLTERVTLERWQGDPDAGAWVRDTEVWAGLVPADPGASVAGEGRVSRPRYRVTLRAAPLVDLMTRFVWRGRGLAVLRTFPDPRAGDRTTCLVEDRG